VAPDGYMRAMFDDQDFNTSSLTFGMLVSFDPLTRSPSAHHSTSTIGPTRIRCESYQSQQVLLVKIDIQVLISDHQASSSGMNFSRTRSRRACLLHW